MKSLNVSGTCCMEDMNLLTFEITVALAADVSMRDARGQGLRTREAGGVDDDVGQPEWRAGEVAGAGGYTLLFPSLSAWALSSWFAVLL